MIFAADHVHRLRASLPGVGIIVLTLREEDFYRQAALAVGADDFVPKRTLSADLLPAIRRVASKMRSGTTGREYPSGKQAVSRHRLHRAER